MRKILPLLLLLLTTSLGFAQGSQQFRPDGTYVIAHFSDLHLNSGEPGTNARTLESIRSILTTEKPDMAIFNGDVVTANPAPEAWKELIRLMNELRVPFVANNGNHDPEYMTRSEIFDLLKTSPYYIGEKGPEELTGMGNCIVPIYSRDKRQKTLLYFLDSNDYFSNQYIQHYDWIHFDQIAWYRQMSAAMTEENGGEPLPALMFFHIPLPEFGVLSDNPKTFGNTREGVASSKLNTGLFASVVEMGDVMGIFSGHDHSNDMLGIYCDVALGYGRVSGWGAYGLLDRGARIIKLYEGERRFDTWVTTPNGGHEGTYYYPSGINSIEEGEATYLPALDVKPEKQGVAYTYYEGEFKLTTQVTEDHAVASGTTSNFNIDLSDLDDHFAYKFRTYIHIPERGIYRFYTYSDDGSVLYIDGQKLVDNDGGHSSRMIEGTVALEAGFHLLEVHYFEDYMGNELEVGLISRSMLRQPIPSEMLFLPEK